jgi:Transposase IS116/IS110/IS902 family
LSHPFGELLASMPGIGPRTGARILAEIGDGSGFANGSKLAAYAGLAPVTHQSGTSLAAETRSRRGNHQLKNAMFLAAFASLRDPASKAFYDRKRAEGKRHKAALICLARRRCDVMLAMLRTHQPYQSPPSLRNPPSEGSSPAWRARSVNVQDVNWVPWSPWMMPPAAGAAGVDGHAERVGGEAGALGGVDGPAEWQPDMHGQ